MCLCFKLNFGYPDIHYGHAHKQNRWLPLGSEATLQDFMREMADVIRLIVMCQLFMKKGFKESDFERLAFILKNKEYV